MSLYSASFSSDKPSRAWDVSNSYLNIELYNLGPKEDIFCMWRKYWLLNIGWELCSRLSWPSYWSLRVNKPFKCALNYELWTTNLSLTWDKGAVSKIVIWFQISEDKNECVYGSNNKLKNSSQCIDVVFLFGLPFWLTTWGRHTFASEWL